MAILRNAPLLRQFLVVVREGSLTAAAQKLSITQPALTKSIHRLEEELGSPLFERLPRGVSLTVYGKALLPHAQRIDAECRLADLELQSLGKGHVGLLRVGAGELFGATFVSSAIARLYEDYPGISFTLHTAEPDVNHARLVAGELDLVFALLPPLETIPGFLTYRPMVEVQQRVIAGASHPLARRRKVTAHDLAQYPWVVSQHDRELFRSVSATLAKDGAPVPRVNVEASSLSARLQMLRLGTYVSFFAETGAIMDLPGIAMLAYRQPVSSGQAGVVMHRSLERYAPAMRLVELVQAAAATRRAS